MVRNRNNRTISYNISEINITNFRLIEDISFNPARLVNIITGKNGTAKSTILGMIAQGFSFNPLLINNMTRKEYVAIENKTEKTDLEKQFLSDYRKLLTFNNKNFESNVNEHFNLSEQDTIHEQHAEITLSNQRMPQIKFRIESNDYSGRRNPRLVTRRLTDTVSDSGKDVSSSNIIFPLIYLGLERVNPLVQSGKLTATELGLSRDDELEIFQLYESILLKPYFNRSVGITNKQNKNTLAFLPEDRSLEMISSGEDNVGQILLSIFSFKKLKENYPDYKGGILLIDEIDSTLYQAAQNKLMDVLYDKARQYGFQVFVTTHSLSLIEHAMSYKFRKRYRDGAADIFKLSLDNSNTLSITNVTNLQALYNEFFASNNEAIKEERINFYSEDDEATYVFKSLISEQKITKYIKFNSSFTIGSKELIKFHKLNIEEFTNNSLVCLDADQRIPRNFHNFFTLPNVDNLPPEHFIFNILKDANSDYWNKTKNYSHANFMNNRYYSIIIDIINNRYGSDPANANGPYNVSGGEFEGVPPREVWKNWFNEEKENFKGNNNPVKFWKKENIDFDSYNKFLEGFKKTFNYVTKNKGIDVQLEVKNNILSIDESR